VLPRSFRIGVGVGDGPRVPMSDLPDPPHAKTLEYLRVGCRVVYIGKHPEKGPARSRSGQV
jgi:hypothetical protein